MVKRFFLCFAAVYSLAFSVLGQTNDSIQVQHIPDNFRNIAKNDTVAWVNDKMLDTKSAEKIIKSTAPFKPDPNKAVLYSAIFPGLGQIYNRKYWKLPLVYGGFLGFAYAISWNGRQYSDYTRAYKAIMKEDPLAPENFNVWSVFIRRGLTADNISEAYIATYRSSFKRQRDAYRRYRDLSIIGAVALYGLCMIDAYVDAHLFDFDISPDLSLRVEPQVQNDAFSQKSFGVQCSFKF